jgi:hypothetical protein
MMLAHGRARGERETRATMNDPQAREPDPGIARVGWTLAMWGIATSLGAFWGTCYFLPRLLAGG